MIRGVQKVKAREQPNTQFFCLSNSNSVFINTILKVRELGVDSDLGAELELISV